MIIAECRPALRKRVWKGESKPAGFCHQTRRLLSPNLSAFAVKLEGFCPKTPALLPQNSPAFAAARQPFRLICRGDIPVRFLKKVPKYEALGKFSSSEISKTDFCVFFSSEMASRTMALNTNSCTV